MQKYVDERPNEKWVIGADLRSELEICLVSLHPFTNSIPRPSDGSFYLSPQYTDKNLEFAASVDPHNQALQRKAAWVKETRGQGQPTVPSTIGEELEFNPFMRVDSEALKVRLTTDSFVSDYFEQVVRGYLAGVSQTVNQIRFLHGDGEVPSRRS
jgi:hypothetical protein